MLAVKAKSSHVPNDFKERDERKRTKATADTQTQVEAQREAGAFKQDETGETGEVHSEEGKHTGREAIFKIKANHGKQNDISIEQHTGK